ncbi:hypothetical protein R3P38DRAFT_2422972, partial [Favolaschia claudopus]
IICTSILGVGVDQPVLDVVHADFPWEWFATIQEAYRGGRNGRHARALIYIPEGQKPFPFDPAKPFGQDLLVPWAYDDDECRRLQLSLFFDGTAVTCMTLTGAALCDNCQRKINDDTRSAP